MHYTFQYNITIYLNVLQTCVDIKLNDHTFTIVFPESLSGESIADFGL